MPAEEQIQIEEMTEAESAPAETNVADESMTVDEEVVDQVDEPQQE